MDVWFGHDVQSQALAQWVTLHLQGGKISFVYIASSEQDGDDLDTGDSQIPAAEGSTCASEPPESICKPLEVDSGALTSQSDVAAYDWSIRGPQMNCQ